ncbi:hypothetical protein ATO3_01255 [Marinibacterium profundimaris]|uniref:Calcineurin-like phosphoesterase domain-containing protein n=1 Tax=Marinibacterium profundimaris TaxID=1679460 RepID=A0A225NSX8_9RHOB|nr:hypothetical protein ATO3_01255 [Marinibacterium profundimaris]
MPHERIYAVGDIHGRHDLLLRMVERIRTDIDRLEDPDRPVRLIFLGDYIDRGDQSREVVEELRKLCDDATRDDNPVGLTCLMGNHEDALLGFIEDPVVGRRWLQFGGLQTLASYRVRVAGPQSDHKALKDTASALAEAMGEDLPFLRSLPKIHRSGPVVFAHAGLDPEDPEAEDNGAVLWGQSSFIERGGIEGMRVVHGHYDALQPVLTRRRICVDTGAYYSGRLTAVRMDDDVEVIEVGATGR